MPQDADLSGPLELIDVSTPLLVRICVDAGIFVAFGREERHPDEAAAATGTDQRVVRRAVSALTGRGVFERTDGGRYRLTATGRRLLPDEPGSIAGICTYKPWELHAWAEAGHTLRTGDAAFTAYYGQPYFDWMAERPEISTWFNRTMRDRTGALLDAGMPLYDWPETGTVVDVGGGNGLLLERLLAERPGPAGRRLRPAARRRPRPRSGWRRPVTPTGSPSPAGTSSIRCRRAATSTCLPACCTTGPTTTRRRSCAPAGGR